MRGKSPYVGSGDDATKEVVEILVPKVPEVAEALARVSLATTLQEVAATTEPTKESDTTLRE